MPAAAAQNAYLKYSLA